MCSPCAPKRWPPDLSATLGGFAFWRSVKMAQEVTLVADVNRATGKSAARKIRREGKVPAIVYGLGTDPQPVAVPSRDFEHILHGPGGVNTLIGLEISGQQELVLARQLVRHPVKHTLVHVDFIRVRRDQ